MTIPITTPSPKKAIIYCRVSSKKQSLEGAGLDSQEHRCRQYAEAQGYDVEMVFPDDASGAGDFMNRPGMVALLAYLAAKPETEYVIVFDDLKRFARDVEFHMKLRRTLHSHDASIECLNYKFEETPEGRFAETIFAAQGELEREQNRRQVLQKMKARVEQGYAIFHAPRGYRYVSERGNGRVLVPSEPAASVITEALEGYASGRFQTQAEVQRFLEAQPGYPKSKSGKVPSETVKRLLTQPIYAGYVEAPDWGVSRSAAKHEALISKGMFDRIQERLQGRAKAPARKNISDAFALNGFVVCANCEKPLRSSQSRGQAGKLYPYYACHTKGCVSYGKSIRRDDLEGEFEEVLKKLRPSKNLIALIRDLCAHVWELRRTHATEFRNALHREVVKIERQIEGFLDKIADASSDTAVTAYERRIETLEKAKLKTQGQLESACQPQGAKADIIEPALQFFSNPWKLWASGRQDLRRMVLRLAFEEPIAYCRRSGHRTPKTTLPFNMLGGLSGLECMDGGRDWD
ncbi:MAG: recombinase family protein [Pseudomonadota bacterium]